MKQDTFDGTELRKNTRMGHPLLGGFLIALGIVFLLGTSGATLFGYSPWILMALLPLYWIVAVAFRHYREDGRLSRRVFSMLVFGLLPFAYVGAAILDLDVGAIWPVVLIAVGASFILFGNGR